jgi:hypothetical protein
MVTLFQYSYLAKTLMVLSLNPFFEFRGMSVEDLSDGVDVTDQNHTVELLCQIP